MLAGLPELTLPYEPPDCEHTYYLYTLLVPRAWAGAKRDRLMTLLREKYAVNSVVANPPVHSTIPFLSEHTGCPHLPISEEIAARLFCVPMHPCMSAEDNTTICAALWDAVEQLAGKPEKNTSSLNPFAPLEGRRVRFSFPQRDHAAGHRPTPRQNQGRDERIDGEGRDRSRPAYRARRQTHRWPFLPPQ